MRTTITKIFKVDEPLAKVWDSLSNIPEIVTCVPGASLTETIDEKNYKGKVTTKFGPIKVEYSGDIEILELNRENSKMVLKGRGLDSKGKGSADMLMNGLLSEKEGGTEVSFSMEIAIVGMLAQFGSRLINDVSDHLLNEFVANFKEKLAGKEVDNTVDAGSMMGAMVKNKLGNLFGGGKKETPPASKQASTPPPSTPPAGGPDQPIPPKPDQPV